MLDNVPSSKRKSELQEILHKKAGFPYRLVRAEIIDSIVKIRKVSIKEAQDTTTVFPGEIEEVLKRFA